MKNLTLSLLALITLLQSCAPAKLLQPPIAYQPGYAIAMRQKTETETLLKMFGEEEKQYSTNVTEYEYHVTEVLPDSRIKWEMTMTRFIVENEDADGHQSKYDTQDPERDTSDKKKQMFDKMVGVPLFMTTTKEGEMLEFSGADALFDKMLEGFKDKPEMAAMEATIKKGYGDTAMMQTVRNMWGHLPKKPVRVGDKWRTSLDLPGIVRLKTNYTYKLQSRNAEQAIISTNSTARSISGKSSEMDLGAVKIAYELSGHGDGNIIVTQPGGILKQSTQTFQLKGVMHMEGNSFPKMDVPISTKTKVTTEQKELPLLLPTNRN